MYNISDESCEDPISAGAGLIGEKWTINIILSVRSSINRFNQLQSHLNVSPSVLNDKLSKLVNNNILRVISRGGAGRATAYEITDKGEKLLQIVGMLRDWYLDHRTMESEDSGYQEFVNIGTYLTQHRAKDAKCIKQSANTDVCQT